MDPEVQTSKQFSQTEVLNMTINTQKGFQKKKDFSIKK